MNAVVTPFAAHLLPADTYAAWRILGNGASAPLDLLGRTTFADVIEAALLGCQHKDHFTVLHTAPGGQQTEHLFYVKQRKPTWVRKPGFAHQVQVRSLEAELRVSRRMAKCVPVEPFVAGRGADVVGVDRQIVEVR